MWNKEGNYMKWVDEQEPENMSQEEYDGWLETQEEEYFYYMQEKSYRIEDY